MAVSVTEIARAVRDAGRVAAAATLAQRNDALRAIAAGLKANEARIAEANRVDVEKSKADPEVTVAMANRLAFVGGKYASAITGVNDLAGLPDPIGDVQLHRELSPGLVLKRVTVPLGVLGIIFEARPDAAVQIASLAVKSGNGVLLKCGREAVTTCTEIVDVVKQSLKDTAVPADSVALLHNREQTREMLTCDKYIDLIVPRGSNAFVQYVQQNTNIPVLGHADGICHVYVDAEADLAKALRIAIDSKVQYPSACNAMETLLVHESLVGTFLPEFIAAARAEGVRVNGCEMTQVIDPSVGPVATWAHEYCDKECSVKVVAGVDEAISHIAEFGSRHTDAIVTEDAATAAIFQQQVASAGIFHNASTRFADGFRYGFGAEVGVSTSGMPPRGPVGLEGLITYKYLISSNDSHTVTEFASGEKSFTHIDLPKAGSA